MSFDDYVHYMKQKYRLAVAIAVIKNKPVDLTTDEYLSNLRGKLKTQDEMEIDDLNISFCSEDFEVNGETSTVLSPNIATYNPEEDSHRKTNESPTILADFDDLIQGNQIQKSNSLEETLHLLKEMDADMPGSSKQMESFNYLEQIPSATSTEKAVNEYQMLYFHEDTQIPLNSIQGDNIINDNIASDIQDTQTAQFGTQNIFEAIPSNVNQNKDTQDTQLQGSTEEYTHVSQSQNIDNRFSLLDKYVLGIKKAVTSAKTVENITKGDDEMGIEENTINLNDYSFNDCGQNFDINFEINDLVDPNINIVTENGESYRVFDKEYLDKQPIDSENNQDIGTQKSYRVLDNENLDKQLIDSENNQNSVTQITEKDADRPTQTQNSQGIENLMGEEVLGSQAEPVIPFKIIKELNAVKCILNRKTERRISTDGYSTDSGYRSDSQSKSSYRRGLHSQSQSTRLNQSGHSLFNHLLTCPLVHNAMEITNEISEVLGELIDKLHSEEKYPEFLDEVLENIKNLLEEICNSDSNGENEVINKDEAIHRLLLLNRSFHIITYTIDKMKIMLEKFHRNLNSDTELYEITNIDHIEGICYILHVLEILLQRHAKKKHILSSQSTSHTCQSDVVPTKSSITDIWKRKWDPEYKKKEIIQNTLEEKNSSLKIGDILNHIVVDCMDGYSLVSFAALQCFNILQP